MAKKKLTKNQLEYNRQLGLIKKSIRRLEKQGYTIDKSVIPERGGRVTQKKLDIMKNLRAAELRKSGEHEDEHGQIIPADEYFRQEQKRKREERKKNKELPVVDYYEKIREIIDDIADGTSAKQLVIAKLDAFKKSANPKDFNDWCLENESFIAAMRDEANYYKKRGNDNKANQIVMEIANAIPNVTGITVNEDTLPDYYPADEFIDDYEEDWEDE